MLQTKIKAARISHLTDGRYFAAQYVDYIGFPLDELPIKDAKSIMDWLAGVQFVGEFAQSQNIHEILDIAQELQLDAAQLPPFFDLFEAQKLALNQIPLWKALYAEDLSAESWAMLHSQADEWTDFCQMLVLDLSACAACEAWSADEWARLKDFTERFPTLLQPNLQQAATLPRLLAQCPRLEGLNLLGGAEERTGVKSFDQLDEWFEQIYED